MEAPNAGVAVEGVVVEVVPNAGVVIEAVAEEGALRAEVALKGVAVEPTSAGAVVAGTVVEPNKEAAGLAESVVEAVAGLVEKVKPEVVAVLEAGVELDVFDVVPQAVAAGFRGWAKK